MESNSNSDEVNTDNFPLTLKIYQCEHRTIGVAWLLNLEDASEMSTSNLVAEEVWNSIHLSGSVTDAQLAILNFLFGKNLERATRIVDERGVKKISGEPSGRSIFQVKGESRRKEEYFCFPEHYCACYSFFYEIVNRREQLCCKHQLAARLSAAIGACIEVKVPDEELAILMSKL